MSEIWQKANSRNPNMGLDNIPCTDPKYWCRLHEIWLSESDVERKRCNCKPTIDLISVRKCGNLEKKDYNEWLKRLSLK